MNLKLKGYLLTYLGCFLGTMLAVAAAYNQMQAIFQEFAAEKTGDIFTYFGLALASFGIAIFVALVIFQIVVITAAPLFTYLLLFRTRDKVMRTVVILFILLCLNPIFIILSVPTGLSIRFVPYVTVLWLFIAPYLARYLAIRVDKPKA